jgi:hypothetical protein
MSGDIGLEEPIIFYHKKMTDAKKIVLEYKGINLAYLEINNQKNGRTLTRRTKKEK